LGFYFKYITKGLSTRPKKVTGMQIKRIDLIYTDKIIVVRYKNLF